MNLESSSTVSLIDQIDGVLLGTVLVSSTNPSEVSIGLENTGTGEEIRKQGAKEPTVELNSSIKGSVRPI